MKGAFGSHSVMQNTTSCDEIKHNIKPDRALQTSGKKLIMLQIIVI